MVATVSTKPPRGRKLSAKIGLPLFVFAIAVIWNVVLYVMTRTVAAPMFEYQGTTGPFSVTQTEDGKYVAGTPIFVVKRGSAFGWTTSLCLKEAVPNLGVTELVRISPDDEIVVNRVETPMVEIPQQCGPRTIARLVPPDAPAGYYELRRQLLLTVKGRPQPPIILPPIHLQVSQ